MSDIYDYRKSTASKAQHMDVGQLPEFHREPSFSERVRSLGWGVFVAVLAFAGVCALAYVATHENAGLSGAVSGSAFPSVIETPSP